MLENLFSEQCLRILSSLILKDAFSTKEICTATAFLMSMRKVIMANSESTFTTDKGSFIFFQKVVHSFLFTLLLRFIPNRIFLLSNQFFVKSSPSIERIPYAAQFC